MGAKQLNPVTVMCQLSQSQIEHLVCHVATKLPIRLDELTDVDEELLPEEVRVCVDFEVDALDNVRVEAAEILNADWDVMHTDSFVFRSYLEPEVERFNAYRKQAIGQSKQIAMDQHHGLI